MRKTWSVFLLLFSLSLALPTAVSASKAAFYQKELSPAASRVLFAMQEFNRQGEYQKGLQSFEKFATGRKKDIPALLNFMAANLNFQLARYPQAVSLYRRVVAKAPEFDAVYENLGMALMMTEDYRSAAEILLKAAALAPEKEEKLKYQAVIAYLYGEDFTHSRALLLALVAAHPTPPADWLKALIQVHMRLEESGAALQVAARLVDSYPEKIEHWRLYGQLGLANREYETALSAYKVLLASDQVSLKEQKMIATIYQQLQLPGAAATVWEKVFAEREPTFHDLERVVSLYRQSGQVDKALSALDKLYKLNPDSKILFQRGQVLYHAGRYRKAYEIFTKLDKVAENDGYQYLLAGYCAWNENDFPAAAATWKKAANYPSWHERAISLLQTLKPWLEPESS